MRGLCPIDDAVTDYDRRNLPFYQWLLIAEEDGMTARELAVDAFGFDLSRNPAWAMRVTLSHLQRARWIFDQLVPTIA